MCSYSGLTLHVTRPFSFGAWATLYLFPHKSSTLAVMWFCLLHVILFTWCSVSLLSEWYSLSLSLGKFLLWFIANITFPLARSSSLSCMPMIHKFWFFLVSQRSCHDPWICVKSHLYLFVFVFETRSYWLSWNSLRRTGCPQLIEILLLPLGPKGVCHHARWWLLLLLLLFLLLLYLLSSGMVSV